MLGMFHPYPCKMMNCVSIVRKKARCSGEGLRAGGEGDDRGRGAWMASSTQWARA